MTFCRHVGYAAGLAADVGLWIENKLWGVILWLIAKEMELGNGSR